MCLDSHVCVVQARSKLSQLHESRLDVQRSLEQYEQALDGTGLAERGGFGAMVKVE